MTVFWVVEERYRGGEWSVAESTKRESLARAHYTLLVEQETDRQADGKPGEYQQRLLRCEVVATTEEETDGDG